MTKIQRRDITLKMMKTKEINDCLYHPHTKTTWKAAWHTIGGVKKYYRSRWESNYAKYLQFLLEHGNISKWEHEPETFWFNKIMRGCRSYLPDFRVTYPNGEVIYHEVKGWFDERSRTKLKRMAKYHPSINSQK